MAGTEALADSPHQTVEKRIETDCGRNARRQNALPGLGLRVCLFSFVCAGLLTATCEAQSTITPGRLSTTASQIEELPQKPRAKPKLRASGDTIYKWHADGASLALLEGDCLLEYDGRQIRASRALIVTDGPRGEVRNRIVVEGWRQPNGDADPTPRTAVWESDDDPTVDAPNFRGQPKERPFLMEYLPPASIRAVGMPLPSSSSVEPAQFTVPVPDPDVNSAPAPSTLTPPADATIPAPELAPTLAPSEIPPPTQIPLQAEPLPPTAGLPLATDVPPPVVMDDGATTGGTQFFFGGGSKSVEISARGAAHPPIISSTLRPETNEQVVIARGGVTIRVRDVAAQLADGRFVNFGTVTISADRVVGWLPNLSNVFDGTTDLSAAEGELYLEGDIVFRQGDNVIYADSMFYNVTRETGMVLDAEAITTVPEYHGVVRLKAEVLQQISRGNYHAFDAAVTSSRMGVPRYWLQSEQLHFYEKTRPSVDPVTGALVADTDPFVTSRNSFVYLAGCPIFYWPRFTTSLERPVFYVTDVKIANDDNFGTQFLLDWDMYQLLGIENVPKGVDWELSTDYLSDRGFALGTTVDYDVASFFGHPGRARGFFDIWGLNDSGTDRLGRGRLNVEPEVDFRGRALLRHRHQHRQDYEMIAQLGWLSDRNFLEQYLENEWDQDPDAVTELRLRKYYNNHMFDLWANVRVNDFFKETEHLPALNHYMLGSSLFHDHLTWSMYNHASYSRLQVANEPTDPVQASESFPLPGETEAEGAVVFTRQELSTTVPVGPLNFRPLAAFEAAYYGEAADGEELTRLTGQAGLQMNLPMVRIDPTIQSSLLNMRGLAHKVDWVAGYWFAESDANLDDLPYYNSLDDNAQEQFRRRFIGYDYGGTLPDRFDPRTYAFRQGLQRNITNPSDVIIDDLEQLQLGIHQRFQTKRGLPGRERIVDVVQFDIDAILFPNSDRDNFGETVGPARYDFRYHLGDRYSIVSDGYVDFFDNGLRSISAGIRSSRPGFSDSYFGLLSIEGPVSSTVFRSAYNFRLNEKWIFSGSTTYDFGSTGDVGQSYGVTRIGESFLVQLNLYYDSGRDNAGVGFLIEPRFFARNLGRIGGGLIPPPGIEGLE